MSSLRHTSEFRDFALAIKQSVDGALPRWLAPRLARAKSLGEDAAATADAFSAIASRGGKRFRAVLLAAASEGVGGPTGDALLPALLSVELFHAYLLIHDDWMDEDDVRRGGPAAHALLSERLGSRRAGEVGAVLAGDLGAGYALEALSEVNVDPARLVDAMRELSAMWIDVVLGQALDVGSHSTNAAAVETMHELKTSSYSVRGPLMLGALLGGRSDLRASLDTFARPLGIAFQLRDDLLGTFGDPKETGKPLGNDLRQGKRTALAMEVAASGEGQKLLEKAKSQPPDAPDGCQNDVAEVMEYLVSSGAKARVEQRLATLLDQAREALARVELSPRALTILEGAIHVLGERDR